MAEQHLRQDKNGMYYWATDEPEQAAERTPPLMDILLPEQTAAPVVIPPVETAAPVVIPPVESPKARRTRGPRKAAAPAPITDAVTIPPPPPIIRG